MKILSLLTVFLAAALVAISLSQSPPERPEKIDPAIETAAMKLLDEYMAAWNRKDLAAWERTFHFPHYRLASGNMTVLDRAGLQDAARVWGSAGGDWHHSAWDRRRIIHASEDKVHVDTKFTRYRADGTKI